MLILSMGIIGAIKMQLVSVQSSRQSNFYSTATELASEMADKIRSNVDQLQPVDSNPYLNVDFQADKGSMASDVTCFTGSCSPNQLANAEISEWLQHITTALPNVRAVICRDNAPWSSSTDNLTWECASNSRASVVIKLGWAEQNGADENPPPRLAIAVTS